ncbi:uncharacterized protein TNCV_3336661 [Trichonephila clavipes]|nr:uncharacterized protein TNCV_3336661 [Trichonephila clavipes]
MSMRPCGKKRLSTPGVEGLMHVKLVEVQSSHLDGVWKSGEPSLMAVEKREKPSALPETILTVPTLHIDESHTPEVSTVIQVSIPDEDDTKRKPSVNEDPSIDAQAPSSESELKIELNQSHQFWPTSHDTEKEVKELTDGNCQRSVISVEAAVDALFDRIENRSIQMETSMDEQKLQQQQRPIEDILQALDQLVAPREVEISIDWDARGPINIREKTVLPSNASDTGSTLDETDGLTEDRKRCIETLLKEVDECLRVNRGPTSRMLLKMRFLHHMTREQKVYPSERFSDAYLRRISRPITNL